MLIPFKSRRAKARPAPAARLGFECLEDRSVPAAITGRVAVGVLDGGQSLLDIYDAAGKLLSAVNVSDLAGTGKATYAVGDVTGDGTADVVVGSGLGVTNAVRVIDGVSLQPVKTLTPFGSFSGGVNVAVGDLTGDGKADIVVAPEEGGGPQIVVYRGGDYQPVASFNGIDDPAFRGGARVAVGDINKDGTPDLIVAAGIGGGPRVAFFDGKTILSGTPTRLFNDIFVFESSVRNGAYVALGDVNGDGFADLIAGGGPGGGPRVLVLSGASLAAGNLVNPNILANFFAGNEGNRDGIPVGSLDLNGDSLADILAGTWIGNGGSILAYAGGKLLSGGTLTSIFNLLSNPGSILSGVSPPSTTPGDNTGGTTDGGTTTTNPNALVTLQLNPLDINLLGLKIATSPITVTVSAEEGSGKLLGNTLTLASHLVNLPAVSDALNNVLGGVVNLLNSASLSITEAVQSGPFSSSTTPAGTVTPVLDLFVAPVHLDLLGAVVDTSPIHLTITATTGDGLVLGNVLTALANLFNPPLPDTLDLNFINGKLQQLVTDLDNMLPGIPAATSTPPAIPAGSDRVLQLVVPPIDLNLLGLNLQTDQINVNADAHTGNGLLLGNVLQTLLNTLGATPDNLTALSNNINALLAKVVGVLNAADLTLATGAVDGLPQVLQQLTTFGLLGAPAGSTVPVLNLMIASPDGSSSPPVDVNLLGLEITTSNINATLTAETGDGLILGNLVYNVSHLLDPGGTLNLLGILGELAL